MTAATRPVLRYFGGKFRMAPKLLPLFPPHHCYVEPFGGAASVLLAKPRSPSEVYNDLSSDMVNLFRVLRDPATATELQRRCALTPWAREEFEQAYEPTKDPIERARRTLVRGFMGLGSAGATRKGRTGFRVFTKESKRCNPAHEWPRWHPSVPLFCDRLRGVVIEHRPALQVIAAHDGLGTLFYVDPPYPIDARQDARGYYEHEMTDDEHRELAAALHQVRGMVVVSGYPCALYDDDLYAGWERREFRAVADNGATSDVNVARVEVAWINPACSAALRSQGHGDLFAQEVG